MAGKKVKNLGDGLMVVFNSAVAAVDAAVAMQRTTNGRAVRVGLHAGEPLRDENDYFGVSVNVAKRLCDAAEPGRIYASDLIRALVSPRMRTDLRPVGALELKGIEEPVQTYEVKWSPAPAAAVLPPLLAVPSDVCFAGREEELEVLRSMWKEATSGQRGVALVAGEPGIGKTRLVRELARHVVEGASLLLAGRSDPELMVPLEPFVEAFRDAVTSWPSEAVALLSTNTIEPLLRPAGAPTDLRDTERSVLFRAICDALGSAESHAPVLLVLDDLHWADEATLLLLRQILRAPVAHILVVVTYRDTEVSRGHPLAALLADLRREVGVRRIALHGLTPDSVERIMTGGAGPSEAVAQLSTRITEETDGNPFFVTEVVRHLFEQGHLRQEGSEVRLDRVVDSIDVPEGIREVVGRRLSRLSASCNQVLAVASVIGRHFPARLLATVAEVSLEVALDAIDEAIQARVVEADESLPAAFAFSHALIRETLFAEISTVQRLRLHLRIGQALSARSGTLAEIAHHLLEAGLIGDSRAMAEAALAAASDARFRLAAYEDAATLARRALAVLEDEQPDLRCDLLTILGDSVISTGDLASGVDLLAQAVSLGWDLGDGLRLARAATYALRAGPQTAVAVFAEASAEAVRLLPEGSPVRARLRAVLALSGLDGPRQLALERTQVVLEEAIASGDEEAQTYAALARADVLLALGDAEETEAVLDQGRRLITEATSVREADVPFAARYVELALLLGDRDRAEAEAEKVGGSTIRFDIGVWRNRTQAAFAFIDGRLDAASDLSTQLLGMRDSRWRILQDSALLGVIAVEQDEGAVMLPLLEAEAAKTGSSAWRAGAALVSADLGRFDDARTWLNGAMDNIDEELGSSVGITFIAEAASLLDDAATANAAAALLQRFAGRTIVSGVLCLGAADRYRARCAATIGDLDDALDLLDSARTLNERLRSPLFLAHTAVDRAEILLRRNQPGDDETARRLLDEMAATTAQLRLPRVVRRAEAALGRAASGND